MFDSLAGKATASGTELPRHFKARPILKSCSSTPQLSVPISAPQGLEKNGAHQHQAIGRSRGGLTTKIHACVDALGNPIRLILSAGQVADITQGSALIARIGAGAVIAHKGDDSDALVQCIEKAGAQAIIAPRSNRQTPRAVDWHRYKARNLVERFFCRLKQFRRLATRYEKLATRLNAFLQLDCADIWLM